MGCQEEEIRQGGTGRNPFLLVTFPHVPFIIPSQDDKKKIRTESGVWIPASYKSDRYAKWKERSKLANVSQDDGGGGDGGGSDGEQTPGKKRESLIIIIL